jgi:putative transferase (TIGR04331 family)
VVSRVLIVTALEETWPINKEPVLFLGEWCRLYSRKSAWEGLDATVAPYHWDNREKLHQDYIHLQALSEELLVELANSLNKIHGVNHTVRYWRILVGPWLGYFVQILFDRWAMLAQVQRNENISYLSLRRHENNNKFVPNDVEEFISFFLTDEWNEFIYGQIAEWMEIPIERSGVIKHERENSSVLNFHSTRQRLSISLKKFANYIFGLVGRDDGYFFISTYLGIKKNLRLQFSLGQVPQLWQQVMAPAVSICESARKWNLQGRGNQDFESLVRALIPKNIPKLYLEGYSALLKVSNDVPWPKTSRAIFTSNSFITDEVFKAWAAEKVETGAPLIVGQHGGNYGMALWNFSEDHQVAIADRYLTWGWTNKKKNVIPVGNFKKMQNATPDWNGAALLVGTTVPQQSYHMFSAPVGAGQWQEYFQEQVRFVSALPEDLRTKLLVRLCSQDYGRIYFRMSSWMPDQVQCRL